VYEQSPVTKRIREKLPLAVQPFLFSFNSEPSPSNSSSTWADNEDASFFASDVGSSALSSTDTNSSHVSPAASSSSESDPSGESDPPTPQDRSNSDMELAPFRKESPQPHQPEPTATSTLSFLPSMRIPSIPRPLDIPLSSTSPEHFRVSDTTSSELDMSL